jgi:hypothetical protein
LTSLAQGAVFFSSVAAALSAVVIYGLWRGKTLGIAFRSRLIARRQHEPALFWFSLALFAGFDLLALAAVVGNVRLLMLL